MEKIATIYKEKFLIKSWELLPKKSLKEWNFMNKIHAKSESQQTAAKMYSCYFFVNKIESSSVKNVCFLLFQIIKLKVSFIYSCEKGIAKTITQGEVGI